MAKENPMPPIIVHFFGLVFAAGLVWACYQIWLMMPAYTGRTLFSPLRIVCALVAMFGLLSIAQVLNMLVRRMATRTK
ncbi:MAG: hypothetical protein AAFO75_03885 [Pseudomonadota bacterium]